MDGFVKVASVNGVAAYASPETLKPLWRGRGTNGLGQQIERCEWAADYAEARRKFLNKVDPAVRISKVESIVMIREAQQEVK